MSTPASDSSSHEAASQYLRLAVGREILVLPIDSVREILESTRLTPLPQTPQCVRGVMNLRGAVVPVIDLAARFGDDAIEVGRRTCIVVVEVHGDESHGPLVAGLMVDAVYEVLDLGPQEIGPVPPLGVNIDASYLSGVAHARGALVYLLNLDQVLAPHALTALIGASVDAADTRTKVAATVNADLV